MKNFITKYWSLIGLVLAFALEHYLQILKGFKLSAENIELIKLFGALIYGYFFTSSFNVQRIGGGGIQNPKK
jgi:hypothetical protein